MQSFASLHDSTVYVSLPSLYNSDENFTTVIELKQANIYSCTDYSTDSLP